MKIYEQVSFDKVIELLSSGEKLKIVDFDTDRVIDAGDISINSIRYFEKKGALLFKVTEENNEPT